jgi:hypothetical protein
MMFPALQHLRGFAPRDRNRYIVGLWAEWAALFRQLRRYSRWRGPTATGFEREMIRAMSLISSWLLHEHEIPETSWNRDVRNRMSRAQDPASSITQPLEVAI